METQKIPNSQSSLEKEEWNCGHRGWEGGWDELGDGNWPINTAAAAKSLQSCPTLWPQRQQPTKLPRPWDSPGNNTGVACHFLLQCMKVKSESEVTQVVYLKVIQSRPTPSDPMDCSLPGSSVHGIFQARVLEWGAIAFSDQCHISVKIPLADLILWKGLVLGCLSSHL